MSEPFTIRIFVPDGNPERVRIIDRMYWTGKAIVFPLPNWTEARERSELGHSGIYILVGHDDDKELPVLYIGQTDVLENRIKQHIDDDSKMDFCEWAICFISEKDELNRAHTTWLEWALITKAKERDRSILINSNVPKKPTLSESEKADMESFLEKIYQILPLAGLKAFEEPRIVNAASEKQKNSTGSDDIGLDTIIVPAREEGFKKVFLSENAWYPIRISPAMLEKLKWIAVYQKVPIAAITYIAEIDNIVAYGEGGKYKVNFKKDATKLAREIPLGNEPSAAPQGPKYTTKKQLDKAKTLSDFMAKR